MNLGSILRHRHVVRGVMVGVLCLLVGCGAFFAWRSFHYQRVCRTNLERMYNTLLEYERQYGSQPDLAFFPESAALDVDSLSFALAPFGLEPSVCICPSSPPVVQETGISYVWNVSLSESVLRDLTTPVWMLTEIHAVSQGVPPPHRGHYHVLYSDGTIIRTPTPPLFP